MRLIFISGFLGAGKTTFINKLMQKGKKVGIVTNDQSSELVDTALLLQTQAQVSEVSGSCFCCNFNGLLESIKVVGEANKADFVIAEPVGSCTDLVATTIRPLQELMKDKLFISPLTTLADPFRLADILDGRTGGLHPSAAYIFEKQLEESEVIVLSKVDLLEENQIEFLKEKVQMKFPTSKVMGLSSYLGIGIEEWLEYILSHNAKMEKVLEINYDIYAEGEAVLGWLNASIKLFGNQINWDVLGKDLLQEISTKIQNLKANVGHVKIFLENEPNYLVGNITGKNNILTTKGSVGTSNKASLIINARVEIEPESLTELIKEAIEKVTHKKVSFEIESWKSISPAYPKPTYRYEN
ncbi:MAG: hypothetical protein N3A69_01545 [Leptospiraceae bacterium]|nr:hypothetical protein [Leptospiraceae bacterium]